MHKLMIRLQTFSIDGTGSYSFRTAVLTCVDSAHLSLLLVISCFSFFLFKGALLIRTSANKFGSWVGDGAGYVYLISIGGNRQWVLSYSHPHMAAQIHASLVHV